MPGKKFNEPQLIAQVRTLIGACCLKDCLERIEKAIQEIIYIIDQQEKKGLLGSIKNANNVAVLIVNEQQIGDWAKLATRELKNYYFYLDEYPQNHFQEINLETLIIKATEDDALRLTLSYIFKKYTD